MLQRATTKDGRRQQRRDFSAYNQPQRVFPTCIITKFVTKVQKFVHAVLQEKEAGDATSFGVLNIGRILHDHGYNQKRGHKCLFPTTCRMSNHRCEKPMAV